jgi:hypothetical protein
LTVLEGLWRVVDLAIDIWDLILNWRLVACIAGALAAVYVAGRVGVEVGDDAYVLALVVGFVCGLAWELLAAAKRRGYI